jgi:hypothetical protein
MYGSEILNLNFYKNILVDRGKAGLIIPAFFSAPGMGDDYRVQDPNTLGSRKC